MTLPFVPHEIPIADEDTLADAVEGEVGWVRSILRMFESSFRRLFLKFERFSSLRKPCRAREDAASRAPPAARGGETKRFPCVLRHNGATLAPPFGNRPFTMTGKTRRGWVARCRNGAMCGLRKPPLSVRLSAL
jgi:hypothetical protein